MWICGPCHLARAGKVEAPARMVAAARTKVTTIATIAESTVPHLLKGQAMSTITLKSAAITTGIRPHLELPEPLVDAIAAMNGEGKYFNFHDVADDLPGAVRVWHRVQELR